MKDGFLGGVGGGVPTAAAAAGGRAGGGPFCLSSCDGTVTSSLSTGFSSSLVPEESEALSGSLPGRRPRAGSGGGIEGFCSATGVRSSTPPRLTIDSLLLATDGERELRINGRLRDYTGWSNSILNGKATNFNQAQK